MRSKWVVICGDLLSGIGSIVGPFDSRDEAMEYVAAGNEPAVRGGWDVMELSEPMWDYTLKNLAPWVKKFKLNKKEGGLK